MRIGHYSSFLSVYRANRNLPIQSLFSTESKTNLSLNSQAHGPLHGTRILDLTRILAGPFSTMLLGDLGAEIIKIERPVVGDDTRAFGPPFIEHLQNTTENANSKESAYFLSVNRNKQSVVVDWKSKLGADIIAQLAAKSDVFVENFIPGQLSQYGLDYETLLKINPSIIYVSISGYGADGPSSQRPGYDVIIEGEAGLMHITGSMSSSSNADSEPVKVGVAITDICTGLYAHGAILAALFARLKLQMSGDPVVGQKIELSLLESQVSILANVGSNYLISGDKGKRWGSAHASIVPYQAFRTKDQRYLIVGAGNDAQFAELCNRMNLPDLINDVNYKRNSDRVKNREKLVEILEQRFMEEPLLAWMEMFDGGSIPYGPVNTIEETFQHPQVVHRQMIQEVEHPAYGRVKLTGPAVKYSRTKSSIHQAPPILGEHTRKVLKEVLMMNDEKIDDLVRQKVVQQA